MQVCRFIDINYVLIKNNCVHNVIINDIRLHDCLFACLHARTLADACTLARLHACTLARLHACTLARLHACTLARLHACTLARLHACTLARLHACTLARLHACARLRTLAHACTLACLHVQYSRLIIIVSYSYYRVMLVRSFPSLWLH